MSMRLGTGILLMASLVAAGATLAARQQGQEQIPKPVLTEETWAISQGWSLLAAGDPVKAASYADQVLAKYPRSIAAAALRIEAEIARGGGLAGLAAYERWLGTRKIEDGYLLRRAARAVLWESTANPLVAADALEHLAFDDDAEARAQLARRMVAGGFAETRALARIGDPGAVKQLIQQTEAIPGSKQRQIEALIESKSPLAAPALIRLLKDTNNPDSIASAADGLGTLNARDAIPQLQKIYGDVSQLPSVRFGAAAGLYRMGDLTGISMLQERLNSDFPYVSVDTARRMSGNPDGAWKAAARKGLTDQDPGVRLKAAELLAPTDREVVKDTLEALLLDSNQAIRELAGKVMVKAIAGDFATFRRFLPSGDPAIRVAAAGRILELTR